MNLGTVGLIAVTAVAAFGLGWSVRPTHAGSGAATKPDASPAQTVASVPAPRRATTAEEAPLNLLKRCAQRLADVRAQATRCEETQAEPGSSEALVQACLADAAVLRACSEFCETPVEGERATDDGGELEAPDPEVSSDADEPDTFARRFSRRVVGTSEEEADWLEDYLCAVDGLRDTMVADLERLLDDNASEQDVESALAQARADRKAVLVDVERRLGPERYARLRAVGGVGLLGSQLQCP